ncbi:MAG: alpha/beta hydrolase [Clostridia bacterium]|nr:alpha/beta hydrolase [Clostridia bacterium]
MIEIILGTVVALIGIVFIFAICYYIYYYRFTFSKKSKNKLVMPHPKSEDYEQYYAQHNSAREKFKEIKMQDIYTNSYDGLKLHASYLEKEDADKLIIFFHGYRSSAEIDFSCAVDFYQSLGCNLLFVDQRAHGLSDGTQITFGAKERYDVCTWVDHMRDMIGNNIKIYISGMSMGASTVMMASSLVNGVSGIIADCGFVSGKAIIQDVASKNMHIPKWIVTPIGWMAKIFGGFDYSTSSVDALSKTDIPIVFIHGLADDFVPCQMTDINYEACASKNKRKILVENASHGFSYLLDTERVEKEIKQFIEETSKK